MRIGTRIKMKVMITDNHNPCDYQMVLIFCDVCSAKLLPPDQFHSMDIFRIIIKYLCPFVYTFYYWVRVLYIYIYIYLYILFHSIHLLFLLLDIYTYHLHLWLLDIYTILLDVYT